MENQMFLIDFLEKNADEEKLVKRVMRLCDCDAGRAKIRIAAMRREKQRILDGGDICARKINA